METHSEDTKLLTPLELHQKMLGFSNNYFLIDVYRDRKSFYAVPEEELNAGGMWLCLSGLVLNLIMEGDLEKAWDYINMLPADTSFIAKLMKYGSMVVHPEITWRQLVDILNELKKLNKPLISVVLTAGRPFLLNGFNDFSRIGVLLPKHKEEFIGYLEWIYPKKLCPYIYNLCLAEYYYQINNLLEAEMLVSSSIKRFDIEGERRIIFSSLYMQSKILLANGKTVKTESFIQQMRKLSGEAGNAEFSYNIDAAEVLFALYDGKMAFVNNWLANNAPDEFANFNMLDLYRYMIKMRCYIASNNYASVISLAERLRPLLQKGKRFIDLCEIDLLAALCLFASGEKDMAFDALERSLRIARFHRYYRLIADEGEPMLNLLIAYIKKKGNTPFLTKITEMTRDMAIRHPLYMKSLSQGGESFTRTEKDILFLLEQGKNKEEIAEYFFISVNTVKFHLKNIYSKLGAKSATQAVWNAKLRGII